MENKRMKQGSNQLWMVTDRHLVSDLAEAYRLVEDEIDAVIIREKDWSLEALEAFLESIGTCDMQSEVNAPLRILNWHMGFEPWHLPLNGIHLGFECAKVIIQNAEKRQDFKHRLEQRNWVLGISIHSEAEWLAASELNPDYVLIANIFETPCKPDKKGMGIEAVASLVKTIQSSQVGVVCIGLGGLKQADMNRMMALGLSGIALRSALHNKKNRLSH
jgi:thiamine monophosphate synthase